MLKEQIEADLLKARKAKDEQTIKTLRVMKSQIDNEQIKLQHELSDSEVLKVVTRELKQIEASIDGAIMAKRKDLQDDYQQQFDILHEYLPTMKTEDEITVILTDNGITKGMSMKDAMMIVKSLNDDTIDNRIAANIVKSLI